MELQHLKLWSAALIACVMKQPELLTEDRPLGVPEVLERTGLPILLPVFLGTIPMVQPSTDSSVDYIYGLSILMGENKPSIN